MYSIVIPAYNEEKRIGKAIVDYCTYLNKSKKDYEIIVISDGSVDDTEKIVNDMARKNKRIKLITSSERLGKGRAVVEGLKKCRGEFAGFMDADEPITPDEYMKLFGFLNKYDCVIASRRTADSVITISQPLKRRIASKTFNFITNSFFHLGIRDTQCGAKVFRMKALNRIIDDMKLSGFEFDVELLWRLKKDGYSIFEAPVKWKHGEYSKVSLRIAPKMFFGILKLRLGL
ncbi:glycosyltransferase family 2 protein [archaeon]|nr:glycosyltransferase family 2 protein [archaeon]